MSNEKASATSGYMNTKDDEKRIRAKKSSCSRREPWVIQDTCSQAFGPCIVSGGIATGPVKLGEQTGTSKADSDRDKALSLIS